MSTEAPNRSRRGQGRSEEKPQLRAFLCYAHEKREGELAEQIGAFLLKQGVRAIWDRGFAVGRPFDDQIKASISRAHLFLPIVTPAAQQRGWVHQEIGFANALNLPILPVCVGRNVLPSQMIERLQGVILDGFGDNQWRRRLVRSEIEQVIRRYSDPGLARFECAPTHEDRTMMLVGHAWAVLDELGPGCVRQRGALSSYHIPAAELTNSVWTDRYGSKEQAKGLFHCKWQLEERKAFTEHARKAGCKLIINPMMTYPQWGKKALIVRLKCLQEFLIDAESFGVPILVGIDPGLHDHENLTIIGNYFAAEAVASREYQGYQQTVLTMHAPSMEGRLAAFDAQLKTTWEASRKIKMPDGGRCYRWTADTSRTDAIKVLEELIRRLAIRPRRRPAGPR